MMNSITGGGTGFQNITSSLITTVVTFLGFIVLLHLTPMILGSMNTMALGEVSSCVRQGERFDRVIAAPATGTADDAWRAATDHIDISNLSNTTGAVCTIAGDATSVYTPLGTKLTAVVASSVGTITGSKVEARQSLYDDYGSIQGLVWSAIGLLLPLGILGGLAYVGAAIITRITGGSVLVVGLVVVLALLVGSQLLPVLIAPLSNVKTQLSGNQYYIYDHGIGSLAKLIGGFYGLVLLGGLLSGIGSAIGVFLRYFSKGGSRNMGY